MLTNKLNLPQSVVLAVQNDPYTRGNSDISVTQLIAPPYQRKLRQEVEVIEDVAERLFSLYGQIAHGILERAGLKANLDIEHRLYTECNGWTVSGQYDLIDDGILQDYKFTTVWSVKGDEPKDEWTQQLNLLRVLAHDNGINIRGLRIIALLRDWSKKQAKRDPEYPQLPVVTVDIPMWDLTDAVSYMVSRVALHQHANPEPCSDSDRWAKPPVYALMKKGGKRAMKLFNSHEEADAAASKGSDLYVERRPGEYTRCESYCNVAHGCPVWKATQETPF